MAVPANAASEHAYGYRFTTFDGYRGEHEIRTNPTPPTQRAFAMPMQIFTDYDPSFGMVAVGTAKGVGVGNCSTRYGGSWEVYVDGFKPNGNYFCRDAGPANEYGVGSRQGFTIKHGDCGWQLFYGGTYRDCAEAPGYPSTAVRLSVGIEEINSVASDYNIDAKYFDLRYSTNGGSSYRDMIPSTAAASGYTATSPSSRRVNAFRGELQ